jgi:hypothetical protein
VGGLSRPAILINSGADFSIDPPCTLHAADGAAPWFVSNSTLLLHTAWAHAWRSITARWCGMTITDLLHWLTPPVVLVVCFGGLECMGD